MYPSYPLGSAPPPTYGGYPPQPTPGGYPPAGYPAQPSYGGYQQVGYQQAYAPPPSYPPAPQYPASYGYPSSGNLPYSMQPAAPYAPQPQGYYPSQPQGHYPHQQNAYPGYAGYPQPSYPYPYYSTYQPPAPYQPPNSATYSQPVEKPPVTDHEQEAFLKLAGEDKEIDAFELQTILNEEFKKVFKFDGFSIDLTRSMVAMEDIDLSGKLGFEDYKRLKADLNLCKTTFQEMDSDRSGYFDRNEFKNALNKLGLNVSEQTLKALTMRYSDKNGHVRFDDFVACYIKLSTMMKTFQAKDIYHQGESEFHKDEFIQLCIYS